MTIVEFSQNVLDWSTGVHKESTNRSLDLTLRKLIAYIGNDTQIQDISMRHIEGFMSTNFASGLSPHTVNSHRRCLHVCFAKAVEWGLVKENPISKVRQWPVKKTAPRYIPSKELSKFLKGIDKFDRRMFITASFATGRARAELLSLKWKDINFDQLTYRSTGRKGKIEEYDINGVFYTTLKLIRGYEPTTFLGARKNREKQGFVFTKWRNPDSVTHLIKEELKKAGYAKLKLDSLRYSFDKLYPPKGGACRLNEFELTLFEGIKLDPKKHLPPSNEQELPTQNKQDLMRNDSICPQVFETPDAEINYELISVMMPINPGFNDTIATIKKAAKENKFDCKRADDIWEHSVLIQDIFSLIYQSYIVICDFTGKNPNVFYEAGIAHTLGRHVIPITQSVDDVPFDLRPHRFIKYLNNNEGHEHLKKQLSERISTLKAYIK